MGVVRTIKGICWLAWLPARFHLDHLSNAKKNKSILQRPVSPALSSDHPPSWPLDPPCRSCFEQLCPAPGRELCRGQQVSIPPGALWLELNKFSCDPSTPSIQACTQAPPLHYWTLPWNNPVSLLILPQLLPTLPSSMPPICKALHCALRNSRFYKELTPFGLQTIPWAFPPNY